MFLSNTVRDISIDKLTFLSQKEIDKLIVVHYGSKHFVHQYFKPIREHILPNKPKGGLWTSPLKSRYGWKRWCRENDFRSYEKDDFFKLKFKTDARIIIINDVEDLHGWPTLKIFDNIMVAYDFAKLSEHVDAVFLTEKGQHRTRLSIEETLYGWDCECVFIMNSNCCYQIE